MHSIICSLLFGLFAGWDWFPDVFSKGSKEDPTPVEPVEPAEPVEPGDGGNASPERGTVRQ